MDRTESVSIQLAPVTEKGTLGVMHLKRYWDKCRARRTGLLAADALQEEWNTDITLLAALGLGVEQTIKYLYLSDEGFDAFEKWVLEVNNGQLSKDKIDTFNLSLEGNTGPLSSPVKQVLSAEEWHTWNEQGYIILRQVVSKEDCDATIQLICSHIGISRTDPGTWYKEHPARQGIMVQLFQHPLLQKNRETVRIRDVYEALWGRKDIWLNTDRVGFNPPETTSWKFPGPGLHWDVSLQLPVPFGLQGILYLSDTAADQGAFTLVPGFHKKVEAWLNSLPPGTDPRQEDIAALGAVPVAAAAGDFIIWHHALPHGSSPNTASLPRFVQYINYTPLDMEVRDKWV
ncbi:MAG: phytanoyl-CoA dioxygenase family protein [Chitinophagaceae bacterium]